MALRNKYLLSKINVLPIARDHLRTLVNARTQKAGFSDWAVFAVLPIIISVGLIWISGELSSTTIGIAVGALSIFVGLLLNLIILLYDIIRSPNEEKLKFDLVKQTLDNISFAILLSIIAIVFFLLSLVDSKWFSLVFSLIAYFLISELGLTVLMVFKRMHKMYSKEIEDIERRHKESMENDKQKVLSAKLEL